MTAKTRRAASNKPPTLHQTATAGATAEAVYKYPAADHDS